MTQLSIGYVESMPPCSATREWRRRVSGLLQYLAEPRDNRALELWGRTRGLIDWEQVANRLAWAEESAEVEFDGAFWKLREERDDE